MGSISLGPVWNPWFSQTGSIDDFLDGHSRFSLLLSFFLWGGYGLMYPGLILTFLRVTLHSWSSSFQLSRITCMYHHAWFPKSWGWNTGFHNVVSKCQALHQLNSLSGFLSLLGAVITVVSYHAPIGMVSLIYWFCTFDLICIRYERFLEPKGKFYSDDFSCNPSCPPKPYVDVLELLIFLLPLP